jgi:hypothetical protein
MGRRKAVNKPTETELNDWEDVAQKLALYIAREAIVSDLAEENITLGDEQLDALAQSAVDAYDNDNIRAECWVHAIGEAVSKGSK